MREEMLSGIDSSSSNVWICTQVAFSIKIFRGTDALQNYFYAISE